VIRRGDSALFGMMIVGFGLLCCVNVACFFPHTLMPFASVEVFRSFNMASGIASFSASAVYALCALKAHRRFVPVLGAAGYALLLAVAVAGQYMGYSDRAFHGVVVGAMAGMGLSFTMLFWFGLLTFLSERRAAFTQGWQALIGETVFVAVYFFLAQWIDVVVFACLALSASLALCAYRRIFRLVEGNPYPEEGVRASWRQFGKGSSVPHFLVFPLVGFILASLLYGVVEAIAMAPQGSPLGFFASMAGGPVGAVLFLVWQRFDRKRDYGLAVKVLFGLLAFALVLMPFDAVAFFVAVGFQMSGLLLYSLIIDEMSARRRMAIATISAGYALSHIMFVSGLYIPGFFGVGSYASFLQSTSLLLFLIYIVFAVILLLDYRQQKDQAQRMADVLKREQEQQERQELLRRSLIEVSDESFTRACRMVGHDFGLTKRETEVLQLIARGRDAAYICNELFLARNTVKGYSKSIYAKLGVHSKQEVIDLVEGTYDPSASGK